MPRTIQDIYGKDIKPGQVPFWSPDLNGYDFATPDNGNTYCSNNPTSKGATSDLKGEAAANSDLAGVTLCPLAFASTDSLDNLPTSSDGLVDVDGLPLARGTSLAKVMPKSATLLHEAVHVIEGPRFLSTDEIYALSDCTKAKWAGQQKRKNPENYVFFAVAMWYRKFGYDFSSGKAVVI